jgi:ribosomal protein S18 acetylase RimI-like enzyme
MAMIHYREANNSDLIYLRDIDLKCHEQEPADSNWWKQIASNPQAHCVLACKSQVPIGLLVLERQLFREPIRATTAHIHKLCVRPEFRHQGTGQRLLAHGHEFAKMKKCEYMTVSVPEYKCRPESDKENDVSRWLNNLGFKATYILPTKLLLYGREFDQFLFTFQVNM